MNSFDIVLLFSVAVVAGAINSVAGGGAFLAFPCLLFTGMPPIQANATNTMAVWPGTLASTGAYRKALSRELLQPLLPLIAVSFPGSVLGAHLLLKTPQATFTKMIPWLLLAATLLFSFGGKIAAWASRRRAGQERSRWTVAAAVLLQMCVAVYFGYFGAGAGFVVLALLSFMGIKNIHSMNGVKTLLATCCNGAALVVFILKHAIVWPQALLMMGGAVLGGYGGAHYAQKLHPQAVRSMVIAIGMSMTAYFFWRARTA